MVYAASITITDEYGTNRVVSNTRYCNSQLEAMREASKEVELYDKMGCDIFSIDFYQAENREDLQRQLNDMYNND